MSRPPGIEPERLREAQTLARLDRALQLELEFRDLCREALRYPEASEDRARLGTLARATMDAFAAFRFGTGNDKCWNIIEQRSAVMFVARKLSHDLDFKPAAARHLVGEWTRQFSGDAAYALDWRTLRRWENAMLAGARKAEKLARWPVDVLPAALFAMNRKATDETYGRCLDRAARLHCLESLMRQAFMHGPVLLLSDAVLRRFAAEKSYQKKLV